MFITFKDWLAKEATAFTRAREAAANGTGPDIPDAAINSHSTAPAWQQKALLKKKGKKKGKKKE